MARTKKRESIMQYGKECYICGNPETALHHVFYGTANRAKSEREGCYCFLCPNHHNMSNEGVHFNKELDIRLKRECQLAWQEKNNADEDDFRLIFNRSYL